MDKKELYNAHEFLEELSKKIPPDEGYKHYIEILSENRIIVNVRYNGLWYFSALEHDEFKNGILRKVIYYFVGHITKYVGEICYG